MSDYLKDSYFHLRSIPFLAGMLVLFIFLRIHPELVSELGQYMNKGPEDYFSQYGWSLYYIIIPCCIAGLSRAKYHWPAIIGFMLAPVALCFSYWLWELLGWVVMGAYLIVLVTIVDMTDSREDNKHLFYYWTIFTACGLYALLRIIGGLWDSALLGFADMELVIVIGGFFVVTSIIDCFNYEASIYQPDLQPSPVTFLYILVIPVLMILMAGAEGRANISVGSTARKQHKELVHKAQMAENRGAYREAANYYTEAAAIRSKKSNEQLAAAMNHKADSIETTLAREIPKALNNLRKEKVSSSTFTAHANDIERAIILLEKNASPATPKATTNDYRKQLNKQRQRKK